jgi:hypothetical protein
MWHFIYLLFVFSCFSCIVIVYYLFWSSSCKAMWFWQIGFLIVRRKMNTCWCGSSKCNFFAPRKPFIILGFNSWCICAKEQFLGSWGYVCQYFFMLRFLKGELRLIVINCWGKGLIVQTIVVGPSCGAICEGFINWE